MFRKYTLSAFLHDETSSMEIGESKFLDVKGAREWTNSFSGLRASLQHVADKQDRLYRTKRVEEGLKLTRLE